MRDCGKFEFDKVAGVKFEFDGAGQTARARFQIISTASRPSNHLHRHFPQPKDARFARADNLAQPQQRVSPRAQPA